MQSSLRWQENKERQVEEKCPTRHVSPNFPYEQREITHRLLPHKMIVSFYAKEKKNRIESAFIAGSIKHASASFQPPHLQNHPGKPICGIQNLDIQRPGPDHSRNIRYHIRRRAECAWSTPADDGVVGEQGQGVAVVAGEFLDAACDVVGHGESDAVVAPADDGAVLK